MNPVVLFSNECERGVLSGILHHPAERFDLVLEQVPEGAFHLEPNAAAWEVLQAMRTASVPIDPVTFTAHARSAGRLQVIGGEQAINALYSHRPVTLHWNEYLRVLKEKRTLREINQVCDKIKGLIYEPGTDPGEVLDLFQNDAMNITLERHIHGARHAGEVLDEIDASTEAGIARAAEGRKLAGSETGLARVDEILQGVEPGDRYVIAGLSNTGKTARAIQMIRHLLKQGHRVLYFMLDGKDREAIIRLYAEVADVEVNAIKTGRGLEDPQSAQRQRLRNAKAWLKQQGLFIDDRARSIQEINSETLRMIKKEGITHTFIDYFGRVTCPGFKGNDKVGMLSAVADQWSRCVDDRQGKLSSIMLAQAQQTEFSVGQILPQGPSVLKDCKTLYDVATKMEALSRELRPLDDLKEKELRIPDLDRRGAPPLRLDERILVNTIAKSKDTQLGHIWFRFMGSVMRMTDLVPGTAVEAPRDAAHSRLQKQIAAGAPDYADRNYTGPRGRPRKDGSSAPPPEDDEADYEQSAFPPLPPKVPVGQGASLNGPLKITRPEKKEP